MGTFESLGSTVYIVLIWILQPGAFARGRCAKDGPKSADRAMANI